MAGLNWALDGVSYGELQRQRQQAGPDKPVRWHLYLDQLTEQICGQPLGKYQYSKAKDQLLFAWHPSREALHSAAFGNLVYLCWGGINKEGGARNFGRFTVVNFLLRRARTVIVNDGTTAEEVAQIARRMPVTVPFVVDAEFWTPGKTTRQGFLFCPGVNDRDPQVLLELAMNGSDIVWLASKGTLASPPIQHPRIEIVCDLPFTELREYYRTCGRVVLPMKRDFHAAGQTTAMEALACNAPVSMSKSRAAGIFSDCPAVSVVEGIESWQASLAAGKRTSARSWVTNHLLDPGEKMLRTLLKDGKI